MYVLDPVGKRHAVGKMRYYINHYLQNFLYYKRMCYMETVAEALLKGTATEAV
jgi:hypothetical protein